MSEINLTPSSLPASDQGQSESGGSLLRQAREASGLSVSALASLLKVSTAKLEALESNRWDLLPDIVFARALASSVCRSLQIEVAPVLAHFPTLTAPSMKTDESGINAPFRTHGNSLGFASLSHFRKPGTLAVLVLVVAAVVLFFLPGDFFQTKFAGSFVKNSDKETTSIAVALPEAAPNDLNQASPEPEAGSQLPMVSQMVPEKSPSLVVTNESSASPLPITVNGNGAVAGTVVLKANSASWVEVVDGRGVVQVRKIMAEGEVLGASGESPLSVVIGRADAVAVEVRGKNFNLVNLTKNNVARFEVK